MKDRLEKLLGITWEDCHSNIEFRSVNILLNSKYYYTDTVAWYKYYKESFFVSGVFRSYTFLGSRKIPEEVYLVLYNIPGLTTKQYNDFIVLYNNLFVLWVRTNP